MGWLERPKYSIAVSQVGRGPGGRAYWCANFCPTQLIEANFTSQPAKLWPCADRIELNEVPANEQNVRAYSLQSLIINIWHLQLQYAISLLSCYYEIYYIVFWAKWSATFYAIWKINLPVYLLSLFAKSIITVSEELTAITSQKVSYSIQRATWPAFMHVAWNKGLLNICLGLCCL